jgi:uncharacterized phage-associated protein
MFLEERATQTAARLIRLSGGTINHMKLIKLMYLVERGAIVRWGRPVTFDWLVNMRNGPVLSTTLDCINDEMPASDDERSYWQHFISERTGHEVRLLTEAPSDALSQAETDLIDETYQRFGHLSQYELVDWCHAHLPEWKNPGATRVSIEIADILRAEKFDEDDVQEILSAIKAEKFAYSLLH